MHDRRRQTPTHNSGQLSDWLNLKNAAFSLKKEKGINHVYSSTILCSVVFSKAES